MAQDFADSGIARLHHDGVQRPEVLLDHAEQRAPAEPAKRDNAEKQKRRPDADEGRSDLVGHHAEPRGDDERCKPEQESRHHEKHDPRNDQFRQADFDEEAAEQRQH